MTDLVQGTDEWLSARAGSMGASEIHEMMARTKSGWGASRGNLLAKIVVERLTGSPIGSFTSAAMQHGTETEPQARAAYEFITDRKVVEVGLVKHPTIAGTHASPDGLVGDDGVLEIKCPQPLRHIETILGAPIQQKYILQMQWQLACTGRLWADFVSFDPRFPAEHQIWMRRVERDDALIAEIEREAVAFLAEVEAVVSKLNNMKEAA